MYNFNTEVTLNERLKWISFLFFSKSNFTLSSHYAIELFLILGRFWKSQLLE